MRLQSAVFTVEDALLGQKDADKVLAILKMEGVWLYAVTGLKREAAEKALGDAGLLDCFRGILTVPETGCPLSDGRIYEKAMRRLRSSERDTVVFTGRISSLRAAKGTGMRAVAVAGAAESGEWAAMRGEADEVVEHYSEFLG